MVGQFFTPEIVVRCMFELARARAGERVIDPSCGDGAFLRGAPEGLELHACEIDPRYAELAGQFVAGERRVRGDALRVLREAWGSFDLAIGNPPYRAQGDLEKRSAVLRAYELAAGRKAQCLEVLFLELFLKLVKTNGRIAVILPDGPFSNRNLGFVRDWLLRRAHVEAIISLPRGIFDGTSAKTNVLLARRLPVAAQAYRAPTALLECRELTELKCLRLPEWRKMEPRWTEVVLAEARDWRPEACVTTAAEALASDGGAVRLGDLFGLRTGYALYGAKRELRDRPGDGRVWLLRAKNISPDGGLRRERDLAYIERDGGMFRDKALVREGEILFVRVGAGCYGRTALVPAGLDAQADDWIHVLTPKSEVDGEAVVAWFNSDEGRAAVRRLAKGVGTLSVSKTSLAELRLPSELMAKARARAFAANRVAGPGTS